jgi:hypothetical protein
MFGSPFGRGEQEAPPAAPPIEQPFKRTGLTGNVDETPLPPAFVSPAEKEAADLRAKHQPHGPQSPSMVAVPNQPTVAAASGEAAKSDEVVQKLIDLTNRITESRTHEADASAEVGKEKLTVASDKLDAAAIKLDEAAVKSGGGPEVRTPEQGEDAIKSIKESIDKLVSGKGLIEAPAAGTRERSSYDEAVRQLLSSLKDVNEAEKG